MRKKEILIWVFVFIFSLIIAFYISTYELSTELSSEWTNNFGGAGDDELTGGAGQDIIYGEDGDDTIFASDNEIDTIDGGDHDIGDIAYIDSGMDITSLIETEIDPDAVP